MAPSTRARTRGDGVKETTRPDPEVTRPRPRRGHGKPATVKETTIVKPKTRKRPNPPPEATVKETTIVKPKTRKRPNPPPEVTRSPPPGPFGPSYRGRWVAGEWIGEEWVGGQWRIDTPTSEDDDWGDLSDDDLGDLPNATLLYPDRKKLMESVHAKRSELQSGKRFKELETFLSRKGLTYKTAIEQLIQRSLDATLKKAISKQICQYVAWMLGGSYFILKKLYCLVEMWDNEVIHLIDEVVKNLKEENLGLVVPRLEIMSLITNALLPKDDEDCSRDDLVKLMREQVGNALELLIDSEEKMKLWAEHPTRQILT